MLFRTLFYTAIADNHLDGYVKVCKEGTIISVSAHPDFKDQLDKNIERIRGCYERAHGLKQNLTICGVRASSTDMVIEPCFKAKYEYEHYFSPGTFRLSDDMYVNLVLPVMEQVAKTVAATCTISKTQTIVDLKGCIGPHPVEVDLFSIVWSERDHFVYPVPPRVPEEQPHLNLELYKLYSAEGQPHCDLTIQDKNGKKTKVHSLVLLVSKSNKLAGLVQRALSSKNKTLIIESFSMEAIRKFIDFAYLGPKALDPDTWQSKEITTNGLLALAHYLEMAPFMDCCTNLLSLTATQDDAAHINRLANLYNNEHLRALALYLQGNEPTQSSKRGKIGSAE